MILMSNGWDEELIKRHGRRPFYSLGPHMRSDKKPEESVSGARCRTYRSDDQVSIFDVTVHRVIRVNLELFVLQTADNRNMPIS